MNLLPCPFCGEEPFQGTLGEYWHLISCKCGIPNIRETSAYTARIKWNSRKYIEQNNPRNKVILRNNQTSNEHKGEDTYNENIIQQKKKLELTDLPEFISIRNIVKLTGISATTWYRLIKVGRAPKQIKLGIRMTRWRKTDIQAFIRGEYNK